MWMCGCVDVWMCECGCGCGCADVWMCGVWVDDSSNLTSGVAMSREGIVTIKFTESSYTLESSLLPNKSDNVTPIPPGRTMLPNQAK